MTQSSTSSPLHIARVVVNLSLDRLFDYHIPDSLQDQVHIGSMVVVPFGQSTRNAYVMELGNHSEFGELKDITSVVGDRALITEKLLELGDWMADYYCCTREQCIQVLLPAVIRSQKVKKKKRKLVTLTSVKTVEDDAERIKVRAPKQADILIILKTHGPTFLSDLTRKWNLSASAVKGLEAKSLVIVEDETDERNPFDQFNVLPSEPLALTSEQTIVMEQVRAAVNAEQRQTILLWGVTGSGKTEIYLQAIAMRLAEGEESIVLVPEIALTPQTVERFRSRFGDQVSVMHSQLSDGERFDEWTKINEGRVKIVVGARSALFAPFRNLGLIIVDEEHEGSYKQDKVPRYHARDIAVVRGKKENAAVILGSATPSLESFYNVTQKKYVLSRMMKRVDDQKMPAMEVVDMAGEAAAHGQPQIISSRLISETRKALDNGEQAIFFLNRRGYATHMQCLKCNFIAECKNCSMNMTYHKKDDILTCHICGESQKAPTSCPECRDPEIKFGGLGTQKIEAVVKGIFSDARVLRMDSDTMTRKDSYRDALGAFRAGSVDILIGTQMIAKGLHFPNVTLVGIIFADLSLNMPDFRAGERTFQLLVQVAGRAGRGELPGKVVVQTYTPFHSVIGHALKQDYQGFYDEEIEARKLLNMPPFSRMAIVQFRGESQSLVHDHSQAFHEFIQHYVSDHCTLIPPLPCTILKKRGKFFYQIMMYSENIQQLSRSLKRAITDFKCHRDVAISVDIDPLSML
jgi:primosomal protein N' (replication factor Y) (superfamily II helicase)